jgi:hypothetical protein
MVLRKAGTMIEIDWRESPDDDRGTWQGSFHDVEVTLRISPEDDTWSVLVRRLTLDDGFCTREYALQRLVEYLATLVCVWQDVSMLGAVCVREPDCNRGHFLGVQFSADFKYCPFCGKFVEGGGEDD